MHTVETGFQNSPLATKDREYPIRGKIIHRSHKKKGFWWFKKESYWLHIELNKEDRESLYRKKLSVGTDGRRIELPDEIWIDVLPQHLDHYPEGCKVTVVFGYEGPLDQFCRGRDPLAVLRIDPEIMAQT